MLQTLYDQHRQDGLRVLAINLGEAEDEVRKWAQDMGLTLDIVLDTRQEIATLYRLRGVPSTYIVAPNGVITHVFYGTITEEQLRAAIAPYVS